MSRRPERSDRLHQRPIQGLAPVLLVALLLGIGLTERAHGQSPGRLEDPRAAGPRHGPWTLDPLLRNIGAPLPEFSADPDLARDPLVSGVLGFSADAEGRWVPGSPPPVPNSVAIYDPLADRIVVFGGFDGSHYRDWTLSLSLSTSKWTKLEAESPPPPRERHSAIYDPVGHRMVVFGGRAAGPNLPATDRNDVWSLPLGGTPLWEEIVPDGSPPAPQSRHAAVYDPVRQRMLLIGVDMRVFALSLGSPPGWTELVVGGSVPVARQGHSAIYDPARDRVVVFGGTSVPNETWELRLSPTVEWVLLPASGAPPARSRHSAVYDPARERMLVFGGVVGGQARSELWSLTLGDAPQWTQLFPTGDPTRSRSAHWAIYDPVRDRMVIPGFTSNVQSDAFALSLPGLQWRIFSPLNSVPDAREAHLGVFDPVRDRMVVFGGAYYLGDAQQSFVLDFTTDEWSPLQVPEPYPRSPFAGMGIFDPVGDRMIVFGGWYSDPFTLGDTWALSFTPEPHWTLLNSTGPALADGVAAYDPLRRRMLVFGGVDESLAYVKTLWSFSLVTHQWTLLTPANLTLLPNLRAAAMIYDPLRDRLIVHGGIDGGSSLNVKTETYELPLGGGAFAWSRVLTAGPTPPGRSHHQAVYDPVQDRMLFFSGFGAGNDLWSLSLAGVPTWRAVVTSDAPRGTSRSRYAAVFDPVRYRYALFGGSIGGPLNDTWFLNLTRPVVPVSIDIKPGDDENTVNLGSHGVLPVAILSGPEVDATTLDAGSLRLSGAPVAWRGHHYLIETGDLDGDGRLDLLAHFETDRIVLPAGERTVVLSGRLPGNQPIEGSDLVRVVPPGDDAILAPAGASGSPPALALRSIAPNPVRAGSIRVAFSLPTTSRSTIELVDVAGRRLWSRNLAGWSPGEHVIRVPLERRLRQGVYWLRLSSNDATRVARFAVIE